MHTTIPEARDAIIAARTDRPQIVARVLEMLASVAPEGVISAQALEREASRIEASAAEMAHMPDLASHYLRAVADLRELARVAS